MGVPDADRQGFGRCRIRGGASRGGHPGKHLTTTDCEGVNHG